MDSNYESKYSGEQVDAAVEYFLNHQQTEENASYTYQNTVFCESESMPASPFNNSELPKALPSFPFTGTDGNLWYDSPNSSSKNWWQCILTINYSTKKVISQSSILDMTGASGSDGTNGVDGTPGKDGKDGTAGADGRFTEFRYKRADTYAVTLTEGQRTSRNPSGWSTDWNTASVPSYTLTQQNLGVDFDTYLCNFAEDEADALNDGDCYFDNIITPTTFSIIAEIFEDAHGIALNVKSEETQAYIVKMHAAFKQTYDKAVNQSATELICATEYHKLITDYLDEDHFWVLFQIYAIIDGTGEYLIQEWSEPQRIQGEDGKMGPAGSNGIDGIAGVNIGVAFTLGTENEYRSDAADPSTINTYSKIFLTGSKWSKATPEITDTYPYIWFTQCRYTIDADGNEILEDVWTTPRRYTGKNGVTTTETVYTRNPIIYPAGIFALKATYANDGSRTPYVYYDGNYYYLSGQGTFTSNSESNNPSNAVSTDGTKIWTLMEGFEAIFTKVGIIANGLIGSAVFNGDYMFSQQGVDQNGDDSTHYERFLLDYNTGNELDDPYSDYAWFKPNICINFKTGEFWSNSANALITSTANGISIQMKEDVINQFQAAGIDISSGVVKVTGEFEGTSNGKFNGDVTAKSFSVVDDDGNEVLKFTTYDSDIMGTPSDGSTITKGTPVMIVNYLGEQWVTSMVKLSQGSGTTLNYIQNNWTTTTKYLTTSLSKSMSNQGSVYTCITKAPYLTVRNGSTNTGQTITAILRNASGTEVSWSTVYNKYYLNTCPIVEDEANTDINNGVWAFKISGSFSTLGNCYIGTPTKKYVAMYKSGYYYGRQVAVYYKATLNSGLLLQGTTCVLIGYTYTLSKSTSAASADSGI